MTHMHAAASVSGAESNADRGKNGQGRKRRDLSPLRRLVPYVTRYPKRLLFTFAFLLIAAVAQLAIPAMLGNVVDQGFIARNLDKVTQYGAIIVVIAAIMGVASGARFYLISLLGERLVADLRKSLFDHLMGLDAHFFDRHRVGELTSRLNSDTATIRGAVSSSMTLAIRSLVTIAGAVVMMFLTSPFLAIAVVVMAPAIILPILIFSRRLRRMSWSTQRAMADVSATATEVLSANRTIKAFVQEDNQAEIFASHSEASYEAEVVRLFARAVLVAMVIFLGTAALVVLVWWGARSVFEGAVTAGQLAQFLVYALLASGALTNVSEVWGSLQAVSGSTERLFEILDTETILPVAADPKPLPTPALGTVTFDKVSFAYLNRDSDTVLDGIDFAVSKGETVALVGPSGAGKSTVFALIERFYDVNSGRVLVDGVDVREVDPSVLRGRIAYVEQEPVIFAGTIADNIRFGRIEASDEEVAAAAKAALVDEYVMGLEEGYQTIVGERGMMLSGGQKQRLAIARALLKDAPILLLDEATSALDAQSEQVVQKALEKLMEGRTTLVIAHRLATIRHADRILVLESGKLIDEGTHDELVKKDGRYAELARLQFRDDKADGQGA